MHKTAELLKNVLIALLLLAFIVLMILAVPGGEDAVRNALESMAGKAGLAPTDIDRAERYGAAAEPMLVSFKTDAGRATVRRDEEALRAAYDAVAPLYRTAFASASEETAVTEASFCRDMERESIYLSFFGSIPAEALAAWTGAPSGALSQNADGYLLACGEDGTVRLILCGEGYRAYRTSLSASAVRSAAKAFDADGSEFAFECGRTDLSPRTLWEDGALPLEGALLTNPCTLPVARQIASALEFNPYGTGAYTDFGGAFVFSETGRNCTVSADGVVRFSADEGAYNAFAAGSERIEDYISAAKTVLQAVCADRLGQARLTLGSAECTQSGAVCRFDYRYRGLAVTGREATVEFTGTQLSSLTLPLMTVTPNAGTVLPLPLGQASAAVPKGARPVLCLTAGEDGTLFAGWKVK